MSIEYFNNFNNTWLIENKRHKAYVARILWKVYHSWIVLTHVLRTRDEILRRTFHVDRKPRSFLSPAPREAPATRGGNMRALITHMSLTFDKYFESKGRACPWFIFPTLSATIVDASFDLSGNIFSAWDHAERQRNEIPIVVIVTSFPSIYVYI